MNALYKLSNLIKKNYKSDNKITKVDEGTEVEANIEDYYIHKDFRKGHRLNNDIAVVLLKGRGIPLGRNVMPICLPNENIEYPAGLNCTISGFGSVEPGSSGTYILSNLNKLNSSSKHKIFCRRK